MALRLEEKILAAHPFAKHLCLHLRGCNRYEVLVYQGVAKARGEAFVLPEPLEVKGIVGKIRFPGFGTSKSC